jgi:hypothetical protein
MFFLSEDTRVDIQRNARVETPLLSQLMTARGDLNPQEAGRPVLTIRLLTISINDMSLTSLAIKLMTFPARVDTPADDCREGLEPTRYRRVSSGIK